MHKHIRMFAERKGLPMITVAVGANTHYDLVLQESFCERIISVRRSVQGDRGIFELCAGVSRRIGNETARRYKEFFITRGRLPEDVDRLAEWLELAFHCITITKEEDFVDVIPEDGCEYMRVHALMPIFDTSEVVAKLQPAVLS